MLVALVCAWTYSFSQMKIGSNPSQINRSSILELESTRQGLLLPRIPGANLVDAPLSTAPDGMIIYVTDSASLFIRKNNTWQRMSVDSIGNSNNWNINGNTGIDSARHFLGTTDQQALVFKVNNAERLRLDGNGNIKVATGTIPTGIDQVDVLVIDPATGMLLQRRMAASAFNNAIVSLNGLRDSVQTFATDSAVAVDVSITSAAGVHKLNIPTQNGNGTTSRGLLSLGDWKRFDSSSRFQILNTLFSNTPDSNGISIANGALTLHAADSSHPGAISTAAQSFSGAKNFTDTVSIGVPVGTPGNSTFQLNGSMSTNITKVTASYTATTADNTILADATTAAITITLPSPATIAGRLYTIKKTGTGGIDNAVTITPTGGTIDGGANFIIYNDWTFITLQTDGTDWYVIRH